ncbi:MAG: acetate/propionate family kinase [Planctomycetes bacterium]|jgi:acetate kinase|nr:acetate/propionate family kinase [Planctomycetota bacterium]
MKVFVVNCGSSSIKYQLFSMTNEIVMAKGVIERVGTDGAQLKLEADGNKLEVDVDAFDHTAAIKIILDTLVDPRFKIIDSADQIEGVGHRVVHGGEEAEKSARITDELIGIIEKNAELAPLHNPPNLMGIRAAMDAIPNVPHVAVFDTAFLSTLPPKAYRYAVPREWYTKYHVRKYGFHGTSHRYVTLRAADLLGKGADEVNLVTCHLGNGCSMTAVERGRAIDHTMGMTPLEGLVMGTRCGDIDPAVVLYMEGRGYSPEDIDKALNKESGLRGVSGLSNDMRDLLKHREAGKRGAELAIDMFVYRIVKYVGSYYAVLPNVDAVVLTGGIGEHSTPVRWMVCEQLQALGAIPDADRNDSTIGGKTGPLTANGAKLPVWCIPTNEELMIARDTRRIVAGGH